MSADDDLSLPPTAGDSFDGLLARAVAAPAAQPLLAADTVIAERYEILRVLGVGGMGAVYLAHDRTLDRQVALKLHRTTATTSRLHREAIAMARLAHPNVVTVFEVGTIEERTFVAMEYVEGDTLRGWLASARRAPDEVLAAILAAGEGLAAAHAAGLVHRDVKPDNILVGRDGRVRIGDFGLAQVSTAAHGPVRIPISPETATGTVVGTPAYMAPEQIDGGVLDARTDQFGFCVVVWEALHGGRPFVGADTLELLAAIRRAAPSTSRKGVPSRVRAVLRRGLAAAPADRWPSVSALLAALRSAWRRPRVIATVVGLGFVAAAGAAYALWPAPDPLAMCDARVPALETAFPIMEQIGLVAQLQQGGPATYLGASLIGAEIDRMRVRARATTLVACRAHAARRWSDDLARTSDECLRDQARSVREIFLGPTRELDLDDVGMLSIRLPDVEHCADARALAGWRPLSDEPAQTTAVIDARAQLTAAHALLEMGRVAAADASVKAVRALPVARNPGVKSRVDLLEAKVRVQRGDYQAAERQVADVYFAARAADDSELSLAALEVLITMAADIRRDPSTTERWVRDGVADAEREKLRQPSAAARVLVAAAAAIVEDHPQRALELAAEAAALQTGTNAPSQHIVLLELRGAALAALGKGEDALRASTELIAAVTRVLGPDHPQLAKAWSSRAALLLDLDRGPDANLAARAARRILDAGAQSESITFAVTELNLGASYLGDDDALARTYLDRARARWVAAYGEDHPDVALVDSNLALIYLAQGDTDKALRALRHGIAVQTEVLGTSHLELAASYFNLAVAERDNAQLPEALGDAHRARAIFEKRVPGSARHVIGLALVAQISNLLGQHAQALAAADKALQFPLDESDASNPAWVRIEAARALIAMRRDAARARRLLAEARVVYAKTEMTKRVEEIDGLRASLP